MPSSAASNEERQGLNGLKESVSHSDRVDTSQSHKVIQTKHQGNFSAFLRTKLW